MSGSHETIRVYVPGGEDRTPGDTPGPWFVEGDQIMDATRSYVVALLGVGEGDTPDARLIASAPDLAEAIDALREERNRYHAALFYVMCHPEDARKTASAALTDTSGDA